MTRRIQHHARALRLLLPTLLALGGALALPPSAAAQSSDALRVVAVDSSDHPRVTITIEPPAALAEEDLDAANFRLTENGQALDVQVRRVTEEGEVANPEVLEVVLVIDTSGSMQGAPLDGAKAAAKAFLDEMPEGTRVGLVVFNDTPLVAVPLSSDLDSVHAAIDGLVATGETALYDAMTLGLAQFSIEDGFRHAMVLLSDGGDTASAAPLESVVESVHGFGSASLDFAAVELVTPEYDGAALATLTEAAGGEVRSADDPGQLASVYEDVAASLLNRYLLTYETAVGGTTEVAIEVTAGSVSATTQREVQLPQLDGSITVAAPNARVAGDPGFLATDAARYVGLALFFFALTVFVSWMMLQPREQRVHLGERFGAHRKGLRFPALSVWMDRLSDGAQRRLERTGRAGRLEATLERAGIALRPGEFVATAVLSAAGALVVGALLGGGLFAVALAGLVAIGAPLYLRVRARRRLAKFAEQLADTLQLITGSLRAGHSTLQAIDSVAEDAPSPTKEEFQRLIVEVRLGRDLRDALWAMHARVGSQDFEWVAQALEIHRDIGGDLSEILDTVANTVRDRSRLKRHVQTLSAEGRLSAMILFAIPFIVGLFMRLINPDYLAPLIETGLGAAMLAGAVGFMAVGFVWIRKLIRIEF